MKPAHASDFVASLFVALFVMATLYLVQWMFGNRAGSEADVATRLAAVRANGWFVALEYRGIDNRTFVVFFSRNAIFGAWTRGYLPAPMRVTPRWHDPLFYPRPAVVAKLRGLDPESPEFLKANRANFRIGWDEIEAVEHSTAKKWGMGAVPYSGRLFLSLKGGKRREFILLGDQDGPALVERLRAAAVETA